VTRHCENVDGNWLVRGAKNSEDCVCSPLAVAVDQGNENAQPCPDSEVNVMSMTSERKTPIQSGFANAIVY
jgi:hypothetical protein